MVSQSRVPVSRARILAAAAAEFAACGFAGAKIDRIARKARFNKAMIYYHFDSKAALYREILVDVFRTIADAVTAVAPDGGADDQVRRFVRAVAREVVSQPHFAAIWLREMAEGGHNIDAAITHQLRRVLQALGAIITRGVASGLFVPAHPLVVQLNIVGPILLFAASAPARRRLARRGTLPGEPEHEQLLQHIESATLGALRGGDAGSPRPSVRRKRR